MSKSQIKNFERWYRRLPIATNEFVGRILREIVPIYEKAGFKRFDDYAAGNFDVIGANVIPLQRRTSQDWPTVEIEFFDAKKQQCRVYFASLSAECIGWRLIGGRYQHVVINRGEANVLEGRSVFLLTKPSGGVDFGPGYLSFNREKKLQSELTALREASDWLVKLFDDGIPEQWHEKPGKMHMHALRYTFPGQIYCRE